MDSSEHNIHAAFCVPDRLEGRKIRKQIFRLDFHSSTWFLRKVFQGLSYLGQIQSLKDKYLWSLVLTRKNYIRGYCNIRIYRSKTKLCKWSFWRWTNRGNIKERCSVWFLRLFSFGTLRRVAPGQSKQRRCSESEKWLAFLTCTNSSGPCSTKIVLGRMTLEEYRKRN